MQVLDEQKRDKILAAAAERFAAEPFHKVLLSDVAETAGVGKGTLYVYFKSKEELYCAVLSQGFAQLLSSLREQVVSDARDAMANLEIVIRGYVSFAYQNPHLFELMRTAPGNASPQREQNRAELSKLIESLIRQGIKAGQLADPHPELTAKYILGLLRSVFTSGMESIEQKVLTRHVIGFIRKALASNSSQLA